MEYCNSINRIRFTKLVNLTGGDLWLANVLDCCVYRWQNSKVIKRRHQRVFTGKLGEFANLVGASSIKSLQADLRQLAEMDLIHKQTAITEYGKQCFIGLTQKTMPCLSPEAANSEGITFYQATNMRRFSALKKLVREGEGGKAAWLQRYLLDTLIYLCQREANRLDLPANKGWIGMKLSALAAYTGISERTLRRQLAELCNAGLLGKTKKKVSAFRVETRYQIEQIVWQTLAKTASDRQGKSGQSRQGKNGQFHISMNKKSNINKNHITGIDEKLNNVSRKTCSHNEHMSHVNLKNKKNLSNQPLHYSKSQPIQRKESRLDTDLRQQATLNPRQLRYVKGMLEKLATDHGCQFSDPSGLFHEICFAVRQVKTIFAGRTTFCHRVNLIAKLLRERRWTTPHGYERYDEKGRAQKQRREVREQQAAQDAERVVSDQPLSVLPKRRGGYQSVQGILTKEKTEGVEHAVTALPPEIADRLSAMKRLASRAEAPDCSATAKAAIMDLLQQHQTAIKEIQYQKKSGWGI